MKTKNAPAGNLRSPIVVILGHVDHGKTTLLDYIRKTKVADKEAGGITQRIGASVAETKEGKRITFIDTPGHAAFAKMRSRGAYVADLAILVVAGEEGVKPQTQEALNFIKEAGIPFIVAATKMDLHTASLENVRGGLEKLGVSFEGRGGDVSLIPVSGKTGEGVENLLEVITLTAEIHGVKGDSEKPLEAVVIETGKDKKGLTASVVVRNGKLEIGKEVVSENSGTKIRGLFNFKGESVKTIYPGEPALLLGFENLPAVGSRLWDKEDKDAKIASEVEKKAGLAQVDEGKIPIILKTQSAGALEAVLSNLPIEVVVLFSGVGDVTENDVFLAKSTGSEIFAFEVKVPSTIFKFAETEGIKIETFEIVYELFQRIDEIIKGEKIEVIGKATVLAVFPFDNKRIAGCKIIQGKLSKGDFCILTRNEKQLGEVKILTVKKGRQEVQEAGQGEECGILFSPQLDFKVSDVLLSVLKHAKK